jgi:hypothetical protein
MVKASVQSFLSRMDLNTVSAFFGLFQKSASEVSFSSSWMRLSFLSMSKKPPQSFQPVLQLFNIFVRDHFLYFQFLQQVEDDIDLESFAHCKVDNFLPDIKLFSCFYFISFLKDQLLQRFLILGFVNF